MKKFFEKCIYIIWLMSICVLLINNSANASTLPLLDSSGTAVLPHPTTIPVPSVPSIPTTVQKESLQKRIKTIIKPILAAGALIAIHLIALVLLYPVAAIPSSPSCYHYKFFRYV